MGGCKTCKWMTCLIDRVGTRTKVKRDDDGFDDPLNILSLLTQVSLWHTHKNLDFLESLVATVL